VRDVRPEADVPSERDAGAWEGGAQKATTCSFFRRSLLVGLFSNRRLRLAEKACSILAFKPGASAAGARPAGFGM
jgi:hypothetical protein